MEYMEDILTMVVAILGVLVVLVPILGLTIRLVARPIAEAFAHVQDSRGPTELPPQVEQRLAALEQHMRELDQAIVQLGGDVRSFGQLERRGRGARPTLPPAGQAPSGVEASPTS